MNSKNEALHLLIFDKSQNDAEKLISLLRNAGIATRAKRVDTEEELADTLNEQNWDLFIYRQEESDIDASAAFELVKTTEKDIPTIVQATDYDADECAGWLKKGIKDSILATSEAHVVEAVKRELSNLEVRKKLRQLQIQVHDIEHRCELLLDSSKDAIAYINEGMHIYANSSYMALLGYDDIDELICIPVLDTLAKQSQETFKELTKQFYESESFKAVDNTECVTIREDDSEVPTTLSLSEASYDGERCLQIIVRPQQDNAELAEKLKEMSQVDLVTGLFNRQSFMDSLLEAKETALNGQRNFAVFYLLMDQFREIKANIGIADADVILRDAAEFLKSETQAIDNLTLARLSDEVFGIIQPCAGIEDARAQGETLRACIVDHLFEVEGKSIQITFSIGATLITDNAPDIKDILGRAQVASSEVKKLEGCENGNGVNLYTPNQEKMLDDHDVAISLIEQALDDDKFKLLFQPIISLRGDPEEHYEAFIRMVDNNGEEVSPYDFLPPQGPSQVANKIDKWVILQTIKHLSEHRSKGHDTRLFINLCSETLQDKAFTSWLNVALKAARLPGDSLIFQVSESSAITYMKQMKEFEKGLRTLKCNLSVNQFGRALDPFNLLKHINPDYVKLEGSYTSDIQQDSESKERVKEMIKELQSKDAKTIVPLVESASLLSTLWQAGVNFIQGYYLQAPSSEMNYDFNEE